MLLSYEFCPPCSYANAHRHRSVPFILSSLPGVFPLELRHAQFSVSSFFHPTSFSSTSHKPISSGQWQRIPAQYRLLAGWLPGWKTAMALVSSSAIVCHLQQQRERTPSARFNNDTARDEEAIVPSPSRRQRPGDAGLELCSCVHTQRDECGAMRWWRMRRAPISRGKE